MTSKEFAKIREFYGTHYNLQMRGYLWFFPKAVKQFPQASYTIKEWARKGETIFIKPKTMRIDGNYIKVLCPSNGVAFIDRKYIKSLLLHHYNY